MEDSKGNTKTFMIFGIISTLPHSFISVTHAFYSLLQKKKKEGTLKLIYIFKP